MPGALELRLDDGSTDGEVSSEADGEELEQEPDGTDGATGDLAAAAGLSLR